MAVYDPALLEFNAASHRYKYDGEFIPSVTTILGVIAKPALQMWAAKLSAEVFAKLLTEHNVNNPYITSDDVEEMRARAANSLFIEGKQGARLGTLVHETIEEFMADQKPRRAPAEALGYMRSFHAWWEKEQEEYECIAIEHRLMHPQFRYCGTTDLIMRHRIRQTTKITDFKTSQRSDSAPYGIYPEYLCQVGAYAEAWNVTTTSRRDYCTEASVLNLDPDGGPAIEITRDTFDLSQDFQVFRQAQVLRENLKSLEEVTKPPKKVKEKINA